MELDLINIENTLKPVRGLSMSKDTFYFSHDYNVRSDEKIKRLIRTHGMTGYGIFWSIIEDLYQNNNVLELDYDLLAYEYRVNEETIKSIINDFGLFTSDDKTFGSLSVSKRIDLRNEKSKTASENAYKRWGKAEARSQSDDSIFYVIKMFSGDEEFIKCGITSETVSRRFSGKTGIYSYEIIKIYDIENCEIAAILETEICESIKKYSPLEKFPGLLDCYCAEDLAAILDMIKICECKGNTIKERKGKENKENNTLKEDSIIAANKLKDMFNAEHKTSFRIIPEKALRQLKVLIAAGYTVENVIEASRELKKEKWLAERGFKELNLEYITRAASMEKYFNQVTASMPNRNMGANEYIDQYLKNLPRNEQGNS